MTAARPLALVTGASSGIGEALAGLLATTHDLVVVARRRERLEALTDRLRREAGATVEVLVTDLTDGAGLAAAVERCASLPLDLLVNNAGFSGYGPLAEREPAVLDALVDIHVRAPLLMTRAALPGMLERGRGTVVNIASMLALSGPVEIRMGARATYAGAKSFLLVFTQSLAQELAGTGVHAMVCLPPMVESEFHGTAWKAAMPLMSSLDCARGILRGIELGEVVCAPGLPDPVGFENLAAIQQGMLRTANAAGELAARYR
jgi:hypothetical protein